MIHKMTAAMLCIGLEGILSGCAADRPHRSAFVHTAEVNTGANGAALAAEANRAEWCAARWNDIRDGLPFASDAERTAFQQKCSKK
jgi:hypothetical protein